MTDRASASGQTSVYPRAVRVGTNWTLAAGDTLVFNGDESEGETVYKTVGVQGEAEGGASILLTVDGDITVGVAATTEAFGIILSYRTLTALASLVLNGRLDVVAGMPGGANGILASGGFGKDGQSIVINGTVTVTDTAATTADYLAAARGVSGSRIIVNNGTIDVRSDRGTVAGVGMPQNGAYFLNTGSVRVEGNPGYDPLGVAAVRGSGIRTLIENKGSITAISHSAAAASIGIYLFPDNTNVYQTGTIRNGGTIVAQTAIRATGGYNVALTITNTGRIEGALVRDGGLDIVTNAAGATWIGALGFGDSPDLFRNAGTVTGSVTLGASADVFDGTGGSISGTVDGGGGADYLRGGAGADRLAGGAGADLIVGGGGADMLTGGAGADTFAYGSASDSAAGAEDTITDFQTGVDRIDLSALAPTSLTLTASGNGTIVAGTSASGAFRIVATGVVAQGDIVTTAAAGTVRNGTGDDEVIVAPATGGQVYGNGGNDTLIGGAGDDLLDGGSGTNTMVGGAGNDSYVIRNDGDRVLEAENEGIDTVQTYVDYSLQAWIENATILGSAAVGLLGNDLVNIIVGNDAANDLSGQGGDDVLIGGGGRDTMIGGDGADRFVYRAASDSLPGREQMDYLQYFEHGRDLIDLSAVSPTSFAFDEFRNDWTGVYWTTVTIGTASGVTMAILVDGTATMADFITTPVRSVRNDFDGDGRSDVVWRNDNGAFTDWLARPNGSFALNDAAAYTTVPLAWKVAGIGDFNGDGRADVVWRNDNGALTDWLGQANGAFALNDVAAYAQVSLDWKVAGVGDFNGDGRADVLWRNDNGALTDWLGQANGGFAINNAAYTTAPTSWKVAGVGDFNGDGRDDILWRNDNGALTDWLGQANGSFALNDAAAYTTVPTSWRVAGVGDFNGDGRDDILWRNDNGALTDWLGQANGGFAINAAAYAEAPTSWKIANVGDYNGDGRDDILWRNDNGALTDWLGQSNGGFGFNDAAYSVVPAAWKVADTRPLLGAPATGSAEGGFGADHVFAPLHLGLGIEVIA